MVPDVDKCRDFYTDLLGMRVIYYKPGDVFGVDTAGGPVCFLKFGENAYTSGRVSIRNTSPTSLTSRRG